MPRFLRPYDYLRPLLVLSLFFLLIALPGGKENFWNYLLPGASAATTFTVNSTGDGADNNLGDGLCNDGSGACTLRAAIQQANASAGTDTVNFSITGTINLASALPSLTTSITINGPGSALLTVRRETGGDYRILTIQSSTVTISGLTIANGKTADASSGSAADGGGINNSGVLNLTDINVTGNNTGASNAGGSGGNGGGIYNSGTLTMTNCSVTTNTGGRGSNNAAFGGRGGQGGGVFNSGTLTLTACTVTGNAGGRGGDGNNGAGNGGDGGGIYNSNSLTMIGCTVMGNIGGRAGDTVGIGSAGGRGGGIYTENAIVTLSNLNLSNNRGGDGGVGSSNNSGAGGGGGGLYVYTGGATITNSTVSNNTSGISATGGQQGYAGAIENGGALTIVGSTISGNDGLAAGGILNRLALKMINSTVSGNSNSGIYNDSSASLRVTNCTFTGNQSYGLLNSGSAIPIRNTIIAGNGPVPFNGDTAGSFSSQGHNLIGIDVGGGGPAGGSSGFTNGSNGDQVGTAAAPINPLLGPLGANGGPTLTHAPLDGSSALDAGDNCVAEAAHCGDANIPQLTSDQRGFNRIVDGPDANTTAAVDIGAYERQATFPDLTDKTGNEDTAVVIPFEVADSSSITSITSASSNTTLVPNDPANLSLSGSGSPRILTINPAPNAFGSSDITITVNRSGGGSESRTFGLTINPVNDAPSFTKGADQTVDENAGPQTVNGWATNISPGAPNELGQALTFQITNDSNASLFSAGPAISPSGVLTYTPAPGVSGIATITLSLKDDGGTANGGTDVSPAQTFNITVREGGAISLNNSFFGVNETNGTIAIPVVRTGGSAGTASVLFTTSDGTATSADYTSVSQTVTFNDGEVSKTVNVPITDDLFKESNETINITLSNVGGSAQLGGQTTAVITIFDNDPAGGYIRFSTDNYSASESGGLATITVQRIGETAQAVDLGYATTGGSTASCSTTNGGASSRCDFTLALGTLHFAAGDTSKTFSVLISQDNYVEGPETLGISLSNLTGTIQFATPSSATLTILDDPVEPSKNPVDDAEAFVRQHYHDFLNREPDAGGLAFWTNQITECQQPGATCSAELRRINVSAAFFLSIEFQETGYLVERLYKTAYGNTSGISNAGPQHTLAVPIIRLNEFLPDSQEISRGLVVGAPGWEQVLENNKTVFTQAFVQRSRFISAYSTFLPPQSFVDQLISRAGISLSTTERTSLINEFGGASNTTNTIVRAKVLRRIAETEALNQIEKNRAFVLMQFFGYLRRNPNDPQDADYSGYDFWLTKLNQFNGNFVNADMVQAFIDSGEYRGRFGP